AAGGLGMFFEARLRGAGAGLTVSGANEVTMALTARTSFNGFDKSPSREGSDAAAGCQADLKSAASKSYSILRDAHVTDYQRLFNRVSIDLGAPSDQTRLPTDERIARFANA